MNDKELLKTIQNDIKNIDKCIDMCIDDECIDYLETIKKNMRIQGATNMNKTPQHYQGTIQPIDLINAQNLNFNLGNVVKYVCRAGKKQGENVLSDLDKAQNYINYEIERIKKNE